LPSKTAAGLAALWTLVSLVSCDRGSPPAGQGQGVKAPSLPGAPAVVRFHPPADGLLTDAHIDHYLRVRRASRGRTDDEATSAVGVDPEEYAWTRARILEAIVQLETAQVRVAAEGTYSRTLASLRQAREGAKDRETARKIDEQIAALERVRQGLKAADPAPPAVAANARKIAPRRAEIQAQPK
jgi:hypothetical protein